MTTENQPPTPSGDTNGSVDSIINDALASVPPASAPVPGQEAPLPTPEASPGLGVPAPDAVVEGSTPPPEAPVAPLSPDAVALQEKQAQIDALQQTAQQRDAALQQYETQQRNAQIQQDTQGIAQLLVNAGTDPTVANQYAQALAQSKLQGKEAAREEAGKIAAARHYGGQYNVSPDILMNLPSPQAMETAAKQEQRINTLEKQLTETKQAQLPPQKFDSGMGLSTGMTMVQKQAAAGRGEYTYTPEELKERTEAALAKINR